MGFMSPVSSHNRGFQENVPSQVKKCPILLDTIFRRIGVLACKCLLPPDSNTEIVMPLDHSAPLFLA